MKQTREIKQKKKKKSIEPHVKVKTLGLSSRAGLWKPLQALRAAALMNLLEWRALYANAGSPKWNSFPRVSGQNDSPISERCRITSRAHVSGCKLSGDARATMPERWATRDQW